MRDDGHGVSNQRGSLVLKIFKVEQDVTASGAAIIRPRSQDAELRWDVVA